MFVMDVGGMLVKSGTHTAWDERADEVSSTCVAAAPPHSECRRIPPIAFAGKEIRP